VVPPFGTARVGPPLTTFADRQYIVGRLVNLPASAVAWIRDPQAIDPQTAMPNLNVDARDALDIVAYLYSIHDSTRLRALRQTLQP
jgi:cytochrome c1